MADLKSGDEKLKKLIELKTNENSALKKLLSELEKKNSQRLKSKNKK